ncbi:agenet domain-containing protein / bromo-adjacent homology (BAH) domain-containing protein [Zea mays]|uniref:Agenet domain-containing protein / bromo-adjacent homology (BAH) domain-containing protein n=2 Tax=Zea mays TaxID=4577 RepID=A0A1D6J4L9_MAIZE|nr:agenet domain-containing protein / bromo-adjacent homology (BAH) domain-containing protein [Zea mays]
MSEEMKRLIAYVKDLYEDTNSCNMVKVQWFDKVDEVGVPLPMDFDDTEIFSLDRQDLNVECIDGLAAVLSVQHYEKFKGDTRYNLWQPYFCCRQIDNGDIKPFDRHKDKIKVRYLELQDADETGNLEEWVMLTRVAKPDQLGVCFLGRPMVRPQRVEQSKASCFDVGAIVDAWWHGGWWEGIVLCQVGSGRLQVYFPGENRTAEFGEDELRCSLEWVGNKWNPLKGRKDVTSKLTSTADCGSECLIGKQDPLNFYVPKNSKPQLERHQYDKGGIEKSSVSTIS